MKPPPLPVSPPRLDELRASWTAAWPEALAVWSKFTRLKVPLLCLTFDEAKSEGLTGSFAMIRLVDQAIVVNLRDIAQRGLGDYAVEVLAHEIGHHVLAPSNLTDHARTIARMRWALPTVENQAPMIANLYTDLLINDRLQRSGGLRISDVYRLMGRSQNAGAVWALYMRIYENLWKLPRHALAGGFTDDRMEGDAVLGARVVRSFAREWLDGTGRFAALLLPYLLEDKGSASLLDIWADTKNAGTGGQPEGLIAEDGEERAGAIHPAQDADLSDLPTETEEVSGEKEAGTPKDSPNQPARGQAREPFQYGEILRATGVALSDHEIAVRYYRERALPFLIPFPRRPSPHKVDPLPEGLEPWQIGQSLDEIDWLETVIQSPRIIPGVTTVQRTWGEEEGTQAMDVPLDLDLYVDSSGSMPNPQRLTSYPALAGAILCLSALRAGARVQATLWSGKNQFTTTGGFMRDQAQILRVLTGYYGGATAFPIHLLRDTYANSARLRPTHILVISDDGVSTMFDRDERNNSGWDLSALALARAKGGGTLVLNLAANWDQIQKPHAPLQQIRDARDRMGWTVNRVASLEDLVAFAREFSRRTYFSPSSKPLPKASGVKP